MKPKYPNIHVKIRAGPGMDLINLGLAQRAARAASLSEEEIEEFFRTALLSGEGKIGSTIKEWFAT